MRNERLRKARMAAGLSQTELAAAVGSQPNYVSKIETGVRALSAGMAQKMAKALAVDAAYLLGQADGRSIPAENVGEPMSEDELQETIEFVINAHIGVHGRELDDEAKDVLTRALSQYIFGMQQLTNRAALGKSLSLMKKEAQSLKAKRKTAIA